MKKNQENQVNIKDGLIQKEKEDSKIMQTEVDDSKKIIQTLNEEKKITLILLTESEIKLTQIKDEMLKIQKNLEKSCQEIYLRDCAIVKLKSRT